MPKIRYVGPIDGVDIIIAGLSGVRPGDEFDTSADVAEQLLGDDSMYVAADKAAEKIAATALTVIGEPGPEAVVPSTDVDPAQEG